jgi:hypothetical protein
MNSFIILLVVKLLSKYIIRGSKRSGHEEFYFVGYNAVSADVSEQDLASIFKVLLMNIFY